MLSTKFIKATEKYCTYEKNVSAPYIRKSFTLDAIPDKATVTLTSTGFYKLFINGDEVSSLLSPAITNPDDNLFYDTYDVTERLVTGKNAIALILGNGMSNSMGGHVWDFDEARFRSSPKLALAFESEALTFEADTSFKTHPSPIYFDDLRSGEFYDAEKEIDGWNLPEFDDGEWENVIEAEAPRGLAEPNDTDKIVVLEELHATEIRECTLKNSAKAILHPSLIDISESAFYKPESDEKGFAFIFPKNTACLPRLRIKGRKGQRIIIQASEWLSDDGYLGFEQIQTLYPLGFCQRDIYVCKGDGVEEYIPSFTYHGARYLALIGVDKEQIDLSTLTMLVIASDVKTRGGFECSDGVVNRLQAATVTSDLANLVYFPTDCPHREKNGWTGDAADSAEQMTLNLTVERTFKQWLKQVVKAQNDVGALPGIVPTSGWGFKWGNGPAWDQVLVELPYQTYKYRGDLSSFRITATAVFKYLGYIANRRDAHGLLAIGLGDWCNTLRSHVKPKCPLAVSDTAIAYNICTKAEILFRAIGQSLQADFCRALGEELKTAFRRYLIDLTSFTVTGNCQGAQAIAIAYGLFEPAEIPSAYARLITLIHEADDHFDCGVKAMRLLPHLLADRGDGELAYKMIARTDAPSYGMWTEKLGLVSLAESFHREYNSSTTSYNHHFFGDISNFFITKLAGIQINPHLDDHLSVNIKPSFVSQLEHASAYYETEKGKVSVKWQRSVDKINLDVEIPEGVTGSLILPNGWELESESPWFDGLNTIEIKGSTHHIARHK